MKWLQESELIRRRKKNIYSQMRSSQEIMRLYSKPLHLLWGLLQELPFLPQLPLLSSMTGLVIKNLTRLL